jgi:hypothetical protein
MNSPDWINMWLSAMGMQLPMLLVCLVGCVMIMGRWSQLRGAGWALAGFGLGLIITVGIPIVQTSLHAWVWQDERPTYTRAVLTTVSIFWAVLRAASYGLLLTAVIVGCSAPKVTTGSGASAGP